MAGTSDASECFSQLVKSLPINNSELLLQRKAEFKLHFFDCFLGERVYRTIRSYVRSFVQTIYLFLCLFTVYVCIANATSVSNFPLNFKMQNDIKIGVFSKQWQTNRQYNKQTEYSK